MNVPTKTLSSGFSLPVYGIGTWQMGGRFEPDNSNDEKDVAAIQNALGHGIKHIDTAEAYGRGHCEELIGQAIAGVDHSHLIVTSKVGESMERGYQGVLEAAEASLRRLGLDYLDLYLLHSYPKQRELLPDIMKAMDRLVAEGLAKNIGVCNMGVERFQETQQLTSNKLVCNQVHYSLRMREAEVKGVLQFCQANDVLLTAWGPLEKGMLERGTLLTALAGKYHKTPYQVALNWLMAQPNVVIVSKTTSPAHLEENLGALGWEMDDEDQEHLSKDFPHQKARSDRVALDHPAVP